LESLRLAPILLSIPISECPEGNAIAHLKNANHKNLVQVLLCLIGKNAELFILFMWADKKIENAGAMK